ncbi:MAG: hypothetical protein HY674_03065 [Chloroflexi bacterium]|nr:hypothetical protein [Chloroflexota bacterium]
MATSTLAGAQTLPLPERATNAPAGRDFVERIKPLAAIEREQVILAEILAGNVPEALRRLCPVTVTNVADGRTNSATFFAIADYLCVGTEDDFFLTPLMPATAQRIADQLGATLPTRKMVDAIYHAADVKLPPAPIPPGPSMTTVPVFAAHNDLVRTQRLEFLPAHLPGALVAGHKKDVVISAKLAGSPGKVAIYGWHRTNGTAIQPLYLGHSAAWADYSHGIRLVQQRMTVNGATATVAQVLADPKLAGLLSDEGPIPNPRYLTNSPRPPPAAGKTPEPTTAIEFQPSGHFGERVASSTLEPEVKIHLNAPAAADFAPDKPVLLILYALPNGNTAEQTIGRLLKPGDDWHFDIQHIGAQTRFLRTLVTNRTLVIAYLEAAPRSWPAWRRQHGDGAIPEILGSVKKLLATNRLEVALTGHSGGGSLTFGFLNTVERIPDDIVRIAFLDSNYAYDLARGHAEKLAAWLKSSEQHFLCVLAYNDAAALLEGKPFVSAQGGTWGRSHAMLKDLGAAFDFTSRTNSTGLQFHSALHGRAQILLQENPERKILHTVQVERNGFIHAMLAGTPDESNGYEYFGERAYTKWILPE